MFLCVLDAQTLPEPQIDISSFSGIASHRMTEVFSKVILNSIFSDIFQANFRAFPHATDLEEISNGHYSAISFPSQDKVERSI
jgi:hypothetical protein